MLDIFLYVKDGATARNVLRVSGGGRKTKVVDCGEVVKKMEGSTLPQATFVIVIGVLYVRAGVHDDLRTSFQHMLY